MKTIYLYATVLSLALALFSSCEKDETKLPAINAPALPTQNLQWDMSAGNFEKAMNNAGYSKCAANSDWRYYMHKSDKTVFWGVKIGTAGLETLRYFYCGKSTNQVRSFWADQAGLGTEYKYDLITWKQVCETQIKTSNTILKIYEYASTQIYVENTTYEASLAVSYSKRDY